MTVWTPGGRRDQRWVRAAIASGLVALCLIALVYNTRLLGSMMDRFHMNDFGKFYYATRAWQAGGDLYAPNPATNLHFARMPNLEFLDLNPPHFHLLILPLALLPPAAAIWLWMALCLSALAMSLMLILREVAAVRTSPAWILLTLLGVLAFAGTQAFFFTGQLSLLLLLTMTLCWRDARRGEWDRAAVWLGVSLSVKPFLLIFLPYLLGTRRFRAAALTLVVAASCFALGVLVFGIHAHLSWYQALGQSGEWAWAPMNASVLGFFQRAFEARPYLAPLVNSSALERVWILTAGAIGFTTLAIGLADRSGNSVDRAFALLLVAAPLVSPLGWVYYLWLPAGPLAAVVRASGGRRVLLSSRGALLLFAILGLAWPLGWSYLLQPHPWATVAIGSIYFWAALALWTWVAFHKNWPRASPDAGRRSSAAC